MKHPVLTLFKKAKSSRWRQVIPVGGQTFGSALDPAVTLPILHLGPSFHTVTALGLPRLHAALGPNQPLHRRATLLFPHQ